jgi:hypothetical protein
LYDGRSIFKGIAMLKKLLIAGLLSVVSIAVQAGDFAPFGIKIGEKSSFYPSKKIIGTQYISVIPPKPVPQFFDNYKVRFNATKQVEYVSAIGSLDKSNYSCLEIAKILRDNFVKKYPKAISGSQVGALYSFEVKNGKELYAAYISCPDDSILFVMYNPFLETDVSNDPDLVGLDLNL